MLSWLLQPVSSAAARLLAERETGAAWWNIHTMSNPLPSLSKDAHKTRERFLAPFLLQVSRLTDYADKDCRSQTRTFWNLVCGAPESFWAEIHEDDTKDWATGQGTWGKVRDALFLVHDRRN